MATALSEKWSYQQSLKENVLACIALHNICIKKGNTISFKLDLTYDENNSKKSSEELKRILKMVSGRGHIDNSKGAAFLRNCICDFLWGKEQELNHL